jgi:hypothetical protein
MEGFINFPLVLLVIIGRKYDKDMANAQFCGKAFPAVRSGFEI